MQTVASTANTAGMPPTAAVAGSATAATAIPTAPTSGAPPSPRRGCGREPPEHRASARGVDAGAGRRREQQQCAGADRVAHHRGRTGRDRRPPSPAVFTPRSPNRSVAPPPAMRAVISPTEIAPIRAPTPAGLSRNDPAVQDEQPCGDKYEPISRLGRSVPVDRAVRRRSPTPRSPDGQEPAAPRSQDRSRGWLRPSPLQVSGDHATRAGRTSSAQLFRCRPVIRAR